MKTTLIPCHVKHNAFLLQLVPESARYYVVKGNYKKAQKVIERIAWYNCKPAPKVRSLETVYVCKFFMSSGASSGSKSKMVWGSYSV